MRKSIFMALFLVSMVSLSACSSNNNPAGRTAEETGTDAPVGVNQMTEDTSATSGMPGSTPGTGAATPEDMTTGTASSPAGSTTGAATGTTGGTTGTGH